MKSLFLIAAFMLMGNFALANGSFNSYESTNEQTNLVESIVDYDISSVSNLIIEENILDGGGCRITIIVEYDDGTEVTTSFSGDDCAAVKKTAQRFIDSLE